MDADVGGGAGCVVVTWSERAERINMAGVCTLTGTATQVVQLNGYAGVAPSTPAVILGTSLKFWWEAAWGWLLNADHLTPTTLGEAVYYILDRRDSAINGSYPYVNFTPVSDNPYFGGADASAGSTLANWDTDIYGPMSVGVTIARGGPWTLYAVGKRATTKNWVPFGQATNEPVVAFWMDNGNNVVAQVGAGDLSHAGAPTGLFLARWRCDSSHRIYFAATGVPEVQLGTDTAGSNYSIDSIGGHALDSLDNPVSTDSDNEFEATHTLGMIVTADTVAGNTDGAIQAYILDHFGVAL